MYVKLVLLAGLVLVTVIGCSKKSSPVDASTTSPLTITPGDGETGVRLDAAVALQFVKPVDPAVVERNLHLISERGMADSLCPYSTLMDHTNMTVAMADTGKMNHLDTAHATRGTFSWTSGNTLCWFRPDSLLTPKTAYMIHIGQEMVTMMEQTMGSMQGMAGHGEGMMSNEMILHFVTMDTTASGGGGHLGHH